MNKKFFERAMHTIFAVCGFAALIFVVVITVFLIFSGLPAICTVGLKNFVSGTKWAPASTEALYGILPFILTSVYGTLGAVLIGVPIAFLCAVYLAKSAPDRVAMLLHNAVELLAGIPSVVYGLVGMIVIVPFIRRIFNLSDGANLLSAILVLSVMIIPTVISVSENAIRAVPKEYEEGSLALGATKTETIFKVIVPSAKSGIITSVALGVGRAIGEAMAVMMVSGNVANMPKLFSSVRFLTTAVASEMSYSSGLHRQALFSVALVLFVFILIINLVLSLAIKSGEDK